MYTFSFCVNSALEVQLSKQHGTGAPHHHGDLCDHNLTFCTIWINQMVKQWNAPSKSTMTVCSDTDWKTGGLYLWESRTGLSIEASLASFCPRLFLNVSVAKAPNVSLLSLREASDTADWTQGLFSLLWKNYLFWTNAHCWCVLQNVKLFFYVWIFIFFHLKHVQTRIN